MKRFLSNLKRNIIVKAVKDKLLKWCIALYGCFTLPSLVYAAGDAESKWNEVINFILPWIDRLGGVVILIGAVEFGLAFKNDDAEGKTKGLRTVIAGCIVLGVGVSSSVFLY